MSYLSACLQAYSLKLCPNIAQPHSKESETCLITRMKSFHRLIARVILLYLSVTEINVHMCERTAKHV
jgi:hypothetical protein